MQSGPEEDPFASAAQEFQSAIDSFQTNLDEDKSRAEPAPVMSQPVQAAAPDPIPQTPGPTPTTFTGMPSQPVHGNAPVTAIPGTTVPGAVPSTVNPVMLAGQPQPAMGVPMGAPVGVPMGMQGVGGMMVPPTTNAVLALVLGILGWVGCGICTALPGFFIAQSAVATTRAYPGHPDTGMAQAAKWVSLINVILFGLAIIGYILLFVIFASAGELDLGMYQCANGEMIPESWVNDGMDDCGDGSDEF